MIVTFTEANLLKMLAKDGNDLLENIYGREKELVRLAIRGLHAEKLANAARHLAEVWGAARAQSLGDAKRAVYDAVEAYRIATV